MMRAAVCLTLALALAPAGPAQACGHCLEDKIAAVYDHAVLTRAVAQKHQVVFYAIDGPLAGGEATRRAIAALADGAYGVDRGSARVSIDTASLSVAFDAPHVAYAAMERDLGRKLAGLKLTLLPLRVMDKAAEFKPAAAR